MDLANHAAKLDEWFKKHEQEMFKRLEIIVNMDSFSLDGDDVNLVGEQLIAWMKEDGFFTEKVAKEKAFNHDSSMEWMEKLGNVFTARSHTKEHGAGMIFLGHMDTVFPKGTVDSWSFKMDKANDKAYGPGIIDMKGGIIISMYVAKALKELKLIDVPMTLTFSPDEEIGSPTTCPVLKKELQNGIAAICTEPGYPNGGVTTQRKGSGHFLLDIQGISAHAGRCYADGASAILELAHKILAYDKYVNLDEDETVNTGIVNGGSSANSIAPYASASIHFTYKQLAEGEKLAQNLRDETAKTYIKGTHSKLSGGVRLPPLVPNAKVEKLYEFAEQAGKCTDFPVYKNAAKGAAESGFCSSVLDIPAICSMGPEGEFLHSKDEYLILSSLVPRCKIVALTALQAVKHFK